MNILTMIMIILMSVLPLALGTVSPCYCNQHYELLSSEDPSYIELRNVAISWKNDIIQRNFKKIAEYTLPEESDHVIADLNNENSILYKSFFVGNKSGQSLHSFFQHAKSINIILEKHRGLEKVGNGITVSYYDESVINIEYPIDESRRQYLLDKGYMMSVFFFKVGDRWYTSYNFLVDRGDEG